MDTQEIDRIMTADIGELYGGTWAIDTIGDVVAGATGRVCYIVNSSPSWHPGSHWTALYLDRGRMEHFCSFGTEPSGELKKLLTNLHNSEQLQTINSDLCGHYCILYLMCRCRGYSMKQFLSSLTPYPSVNDCIVKAIV
jgi:hypothetical protein